MLDIGKRSQSTIVPVQPGSNMPAGTIISYSGSVSSFTSTASADSTTLIHKDGWAMCNGASIPFATYAQLYARLSTTWNATTNPLTGSLQSAPADTGVNFRIPNLQGTFLRGVGDFTDNTMDSVLGVHQGDKTRPAGLSVSADGTVNLSHYHTTTFQGSGALSAPAGVAIDALPMYNNGSWYNLNSSSSASLDHDHTCSISGDSETRPQNVGVYFLVKLYDNLANVDVYIPEANATTTGLLTKDAQVVGGVKTFSAGALIKGRTDGVVASNGYVGQTFGSANTVATARSYSLRSTSVFTSGGTVVISTTLDKGDYLISALVKMYHTSVVGFYFNFSFGGTWEEVTTHHRGVTNASEYVTATIPMFPVTILGDNTTVTLIGVSGGTIADQANEVHIIRI